MGLAHPRATTGLRPPPDTRPAEGDADSVAVSRIVKAFVGDPMLGHMPRHFDGCEDCAEAMRRACRTYDSLPSWARRAIAAGKISVTGNENGIVIRVKVRGGRTREAFEGDVIEVTGSGALLIA